MPESLYKGTDGETPESLYKGTDGETPESLYKGTDGETPRRAALSRGRPHTPSIAFPHLPPDSIRTEGALFISAQLSTDTVSALRKVRVLIRLRKQLSVKART